MNDEARLFWKKARTAISAAEQNVEIDPSTAGNRAYYAAFYAVSALLLERHKKSYKRHSAVEAAVYRDLVRTGTWSEELGNFFRDLRRLRTTADYDALYEVTKQEAEDAVTKAKQILHAVAVQLPASDDE